jgi:hypothetical protein
MAQRQQRVSDRDRRLAAAARQKQAAGRRPTKAEQRALHKVTEALRYQTFLEVAAAVPKWQIIKWANRQHKTVDEASDRYGLPCIGEEIDMAEVFRWIFAFLKENSRQLMSTEGEDPMSGLDSPMLERWREEKWKLAKLERQQREQLLLPRHEVHESLGRMASIMRQAADTLQKHHGPIQPAEAYGVMMEAVDNWDRVLETLFGDDRDPDTDD